MTRARLWTRLVRLEEQASQIFWYDDDLAQMLRYVAEAGTQADLAPNVLQALCAEVRQAGETLGQQCPRHYRLGSDEQKTVIERMVSTMVTTMNAQLTDPSTNRRMHQAVRNVVEAAREVEQRAMRR